MNYGNFKLSGSAMAAYLGVLTLPNKKSTLIMRSDISNLNNARKFSFDWEALPKNGSYIFKNKGSHLYLDYNQLERVVVNGVLLCKILLTSNEPKTGNIHIHYIHLGDDVSYINFAYDVEKGLIPLVYLINPEDENENAYLPYLLLDEKMNAISDYTKREEELLKHGISSEFMMI